MNDLTGKKMVFWKSGRFGGVVACEMVANGGSTAVKIKQYLRCSILVCFHSAFTLPFSGCAGVTVFNSTETASSLSSG